MKKALIVVDIQPDFMEGGPLAVPGASDIIPFVVDLIKNGGYDFIAVTQDWHPKDHGSFASVSNEKLFSLGKLSDLDQVFWPDHCIQNTLGAEIDYRVMRSLRDLDRSKWSLVQKGMDVSVDSYSGFMDNGGKNKTIMSSLLKSNDISEVDVVGLAYDYCVSYTAKDAALEGFKARILLSGTRAIEQNVDALNIIKSNLNNLGIVVE